MLTRGRVVVAAGLVAIAAGAGAVAPAQADGEADDVAACEAISNIGDEVLAPDEGASEPYVDLQVAAADSRLAAAGRLPGEGVRVAVLDSGIAPGFPAQRPIDGPHPVIPPNPDRQPGDIYYHGTAVASVIAGPDRPDALGGGPVGFAPDVTLIDIPVYDTPVPPEDGNGGTAPDGGYLIRGLDEAVARGADVINVSIAVMSDTPQLREAVARAARTAIVVASTGNRPAEGDGSDYAREYATVDDREDAAEVVWPAGYAVDSETGPRIPGVVAVNSTVPDGQEPSAYVLANSATTVAVPSAGVTAYSVAGPPCRIVVPTTSMAAAEVTGVLALLMARFPDENQAQILARLTETAAGGSGPDAPLPDKFVGRGVVQPLNALSTLLEPDRKGRVPRVEQPVLDPEPAFVQPEAADPLSETRQHAIWWGLGGAGALVVAAILRPVLARRRRS